MQVRSLPRRLRDTWSVRPNSGCQRYKIVAVRNLYAECRSLAALAAEDEGRARERIGGENPPHLRRQPVEAAPQVDGLAGEIDFDPGGEAQHHNPLSVESTRRRTSPSTPSSMRTCAPLGRRTSIAPSRAALGAANLARLPARPASASAPPAAPRQGGSEQISGFRSPHATSLSPPARRPHR